MDTLAMGATSQTPKCGVCAVRKGQRCVTLDGAAPPTVNTQRTFSALRSVYYNNYGN
jgi:hypothetical protein